MPDAASPHAASRAAQDRRLARAGGVLGLATAVAGAVVLLGWGLDVHALRSLGSGSIEMRANTAVAFVLCGLALWLLGTPVHPAARTGARTLAAAAGLIGLVALLEYLLHADFGIDPWRSAGPDSPLSGRMAFTTALDFVLLAAAIWTVDTRTARGRHPSHWLALAIAITAFLAVLGYVYGVDALHRLAAATSMALPTALLMLVACAAVVLVRPATRFLRRILRDDAAGLVNRRLLPAAIVLPAAVGWLALQGQHAGLYPSEYRLALTAVANVGLFSALVWWSATALQAQHGRQRALEQANTWQQGIINSAHLSVISCDTAGTIRTVNDAAAAQLGYRREELEGHASVAQIHDPEELSARAQQLRERFGGALATHTEVLLAMARRGLRDEDDWTYVRRDGSRFPVHLSITAIHDDTGELTGFLGIGYDITRQKQAEARLLQLARNDSLTGLPNRASFEEHLAEAIARGQRSGQPLALLFLDLDRFKSINDVHGHLGGDLVLKEFARRLQALVRASDLVARLAGDEFVIVLEGLQGDEDARTVADKVVEVMAEPMRVLDVAVPVSASIGVAMLDPASALNCAQLLHRADEALYEAKRAGRGRYCVHA